ncbi:MAG: heme/hemin ABC transporter substrate-binding protein [Gammaproteobacteria bacterium]
MKNTLYGAACAAFLFTVFGNASALPADQSGSTQASSAKGFSNVTQPGNQPAHYNLDRVVCVSKQINEFIYEAGAEKHLVAHDLTSVYPPAIRKLPTVGYHRALSAEGIISMQPTVFLTDGNMGPHAVLGQLEEVGVPIKVITPGKSMADAQQLMLKVGTFFDREKQAEQVVAQWKQDMAKVMAASKLWANKPKLRVVMIHFGQIDNSYLAVTGGPSNQLIEWAGGNNILANNHGMERLTPELIADAQPDIIIANQIAFDRFGNSKAFTQLPGVALTPAGKNGRIYMIMEQQSIYFGPRTPAAILKLAEDFHPEVFKAHPELIKLLKGLENQYPSTDYKYGTGVGTDNRS